MLEVKKLELGKEQELTLQVTGLARNDKTQIPATGHLTVTATLRSKVNWKQMGNFLALC